MLRILLRSASKIGRGKQKFSAEQGVNGTGHRRRFAFKFTTVVRHHSIYLALVVPVAGQMTCELHHETASLQSAAADSDRLQRSEVSALPDVANILMQNLDGLTANQHS
jgi:hypothetical protein